MSIINVTLFYEIKVFKNIYSYKTRYQNSRNMRENLFKRKLKSKAVAPYRENTRGIIKILRVLLKRRIYIMFTLSEAKEIQGKCFLNLHENLTQTLNWYLYLIKTDRESTNNKNVLFMRLNF